jgi:hypothetical protein
MDNPFSVERFVKQLNMPSELTKAMVVALKAIYITDDESTKVLGDFSQEEWQKAGLPILGFKYLKRYLGTHYNLLY